MLSFKMPIKILLLIIFTFISWNLIPNSTSSAMDRFSPYIKITAENIAKNNQLTNEFQNKLALLHEEDYLIEVSKNLEKYHEILKPPTIAYDITSDSYEISLNEKCTDEEAIIEIKGTPFQNLSSICLHQRLHKNFMDYTKRLDESLGNPNHKEFLRAKVSEANRVSVDFYTENYSAYILHSQYDQIKKELETMNSKLYDVFMEVKHYPKKLPNATTTSCT